MTNSSAQDRHIWDTPGCVGQYLCHRGQAAAGPIQLYPGSQTVTQTEVSCHHFSSRIKQQEEEKKQKKKKQDLMTNLLRCRQVCRLGRTLGVPAGLLPGDALLSALLLLSIYTSLHCSCGKVNKVAWTSSSFPANHCSHQHKVVYRYWLVMDNSLTQPIGTLTTFVLSIETSQKWLRQVLPEEINCQIEKCWCEKFLVIYGRIAS